MAIFVYSGTGNSLAAAKQLAREFDLRVVHITAELAGSRAEYSGEMGIVIFPTYGYGMPLTVKRFILNSRFNFKYLAVLTTIGSHHGGALAEAVRDFKKAGSRVHYTKGIKSVENYVHMFGWRAVRRADGLLTKQSTITAAVASDLRGRVQNKRLPFRPFSSFVAWLLRRANRMFAKRYKVLPTCNGCGICRRVCPANAITMCGALPFEVLHDTPKARPAAGKEQGVVADTSKRLPLSDGSRPRLDVALQAGGGVFSRAVGQAAQLELNSLGGARQSPQNIPTGPAVVPCFAPGKCEHCQACLQLCPRRAIKFGRINEKSPRYLHRDVTVGEMLKRD